MNISQISKQSLFENKPHKNQLQKGVVNGGLFANADKLGTGKEDKTSSLIKSLYEQKNNLLESKRQLMADAAENGGGITQGVKAQLSDLEDQLKLLDEQISQQLLDEQKEALGLDKTKEKDKFEKSPANPQTPEEAEADKVKDLLSINSTMAQAKTIGALKKDMQGTVKVLEMEAALDESRSISGERSSKRDHILKLKSRIAKMDEKIGKNLNEVMEKGQAASKAEAAPEDLANSVGDPLSAEMTEKNSDQNTAAQ